MCSMYSTSCSSWVNHSTPRLCRFFAPLAKAAPSPAGTWMCGMGSQYFIHTTARMGCHWSLHLPSGTWKKKQPTTLATSSTSSTPLRCRAPTLPLPTASSCPSLLLSCGSLLLGPVVGTVCTALTQSYHAPRAW